MSRRLVVMVLILFCTATNAFFVGPQRLIGRSWQVNNHIRLFAAATASRYSLTTIPSEIPKNYRLVIVESPSKCKTISKILDQYTMDHSLDYSYVVTSCMGHLRNLPKSQPKDQPKQTIVGIDIHNAYTPTYVILPGKETLVKDLQALANTAQQVVIATDDDREGEAIGWHLVQLLPHTTPHVRVTFGEITKSAIYASMQHAQPTLDMDLVQAQETRRILDRLAGYTVSPILWKKIAPGLSAGRVQSVGMAMIVQRERERLKHVPADYCDLILVLENNVTATLSMAQGKQVASGTDFDNFGTLLSTNKTHLDAAATQRLVDSMSTSGTYSITKIVSKERRQSPPVPFTTSTLQQEGNKRLGMSVSQIMSTAQQLYENGYISYMRTDSSHLSKDAQQATMISIERKFGKQMVGDGPGANSKKAKNAQEAHEAIRPAIQEDGSFLDPTMTTLADAQLSLYQFIYGRTVASYMTSQVLNSTSVDICGVSADGDTVLNFRTSGSVVVEPGYTLAWGKSSTDSLLPPWKQGQVLHSQDLLPKSHTTLPPPRYNEASFVKALEELGVGRPSTYAGVVQLLRDRAYVGSPGESSSKSMRQKAVSGPAISAQRAAGGQEFVGDGRGPLVPSLSAFVVCSLLENHCSSYVDPSFTATMEERLDEIARGKVGAERVKYLDEFYAGENGLAAKILAIDQSVHPDDARRAHLPSLFSNETSIGLFIGPWGPYVQKLSSEDGEKPPTAPLPAGMASDLSTITIPTLEALLSSREKDGILLGTHPDDDREIRLKVGRYGAFLQWGLTGDEGTTTHSLPKHIGSMRNLDLTPDDEMSLSSMIGLSLDDAVGYVGLPRLVGTLHDLPILASIGPYGPYLKFNNSYASLNKADGDVLTIDKDAAIQVVTDGIINKSSKLGRGVLAQLGEMNGSMVSVKDGRFGMYISWKKINAKMPVEYQENPSELPLENAWALLEEKGAGSELSTKKNGAKKTATNWDLPVAPKRPKSAYLHFCADKRAEATTTSKSLGDVSKELARLWADTENDPAARQPYDMLAAQEKEAYEELKKVWKDDCQKIMNTLPGAAKIRVNGATSSKTKSKSPDQPKRGLSSYLFFCAEKRAEISERVKSLGDVSKELARLWSETEDRSNYEAMAAADAIRYGQAMIDFKANGSSVNSAKPQRTGTKGAKKETISPKRTALTPSTTTKKATATNVAQKDTVTPKRAPSAYMLFCSEYRSTIVDSNGKKLPLGQTTKRLAELWKECDPDITAKFHAQAEEGKRAQV